MEKFNPTYSLEEFKHSDFKITLTDQKTAYDLGFDDGAETFLQVDDFIRRP